MGDVILCGLCGLWFGKRRAANAAPALKDLDARGTATGSLLRGRRIGPELGRSQEGLRTDP